MVAQVSAANDLVIGIDAGGTHTRVALAPVGCGSAILSTGTAGPGNAMSVPPAQLTSHLARAIALATPAQQRERVRSVVAGLAGCSATPGNPGRAVAESALRAALQQLGIRPDLVDVHSDTEVAFAGAPGAPSDGLILIAGTGAVAGRVTGGRQRATADGDGWLLGDGGSGFWIGRRAVRRVLGALDGRGRATLLTAAVTAHYLGEAVPERPSDPPAGQEVRDRLIRAVHARPAIDLAGLCPLVASTAAQGDAVARRLLSGAAKRLAATLSTLDPRAGEVLVTTGGLLGPDGVLIDYLAPRLAPVGLRPLPVADGLAGAVTLARLAR
jgi:N-acetylglucosamine kinase-like BadF-type ATPase